MSRATVLVEVCRDDVVAAGHKPAPAARRGAVADMMAGPRASRWYPAVFLAISERWKGGGP
ncbi:MAG: hypothetical protein ACLQFR_00135 [Streptosporangiaceae bacterium]